MPTVACLQCNSTNRVPQERLSDNPYCGRYGAPLFQGMPVTLTAANFDRHANAELPMLVDFWAEWCAPCRQVAPIVKEIADSYGETLKVVKINIDDSPQVPGNYGIRSIPTILAFKDGQVVSQLVGLRPKGDFEEMVNRVL